MQILVAGGAGYIGTHTIIELIAHGHTPIVVDSLSNSSQEGLRRVEKITGQSITFYKTDCTNTSELAAIFDNHAIDAVILFAGFKAVGESVENPLLYYRNNLDVALTISEVMNEKNVKKLIFSSSAVVYGTPKELPLKETSLIGSGITNPYGWTKYMIEQVLRDLAQADKTFQITALRYFNPIGAHPSGIIGEDPKGVPQNLLPYISQVAVGKRDKLRIFGNDYDTPDGTCMRDYIHVVDLAKGHVAALEQLKSGGKLQVYNLGTGRATSVFELLHAFESACDKQIPYEVAGRRAGDVAVVYADPSLAQEELHWSATKDIAEACADAWRWQSQNPQGFAG